MHQVTSEADLIGKMSPLLQGSVAMRANRVWLDQIWFFRGLDQTREVRS